MRSRFPGGLLAVAMFALSGAVRADPVDDIVTAEIARQQIPGASIAVIKDGRVIKEAGYGMANLEHQVAVTPDTVFQSGSAGKQFTAALVLLLAEDGKLRLDDPISRHLAGTPPAWKRITVRHLLNHSAGLRDPDDILKLNQDYTDTQLQRAGSTLPLQWAPGTKWAYSNFGYQLLGMLCTRVGGKFYGEQLRERIFAPAGMQARIISERDIVPHRAAGDDVVEGEFKNQEWVSPTLNTTADGSLYLTVRDLAKWHIALDGDQLLGAAIKQAMWTPTTLRDGSTVPYGFGWETSPTLERRSLWHDGAWQGFTTQGTRFVDDGLAVVVLANRSEAKVDTLLELVAAHYLRASR
ncbi:serine hydrolase domain-containing protein [Massilia scottii]|uniref:serine hydrolase domain-containing protein n=1 Tax=Massilia scottii TaxID=3057166 RepID=UPI0027969412|nr:serine hydrolase domain-containing protein [Massilia sp. CCM 9029]MDQ1832136.1 serine hydrolase domain-containing protein [Massilia sp. CCM 9029]